MATGKPARGQNQGNLAARRILAVTEEELQRIVLDIHDGPVQYLFAALSQIKLLQKELAQAEPPSTAETGRALERIAHLLSQSQQEIRGFLGAFRPPDFARRNLADILQGLIIQHEATTGCQVDFNVGQEPMPASLPVKIALYRLCQEALANAYRHSGSSQQQVRLARQGESILLEVRDQGRGFLPPPLDGPQATERAEHIGLRGMRDRVGLVGGTFALRAAPGQGVCICVTVPADA